jgi:hypothetical protein
VLGASPDSPSIPEAENRSRLTEICIQRKIPLLMRLVGGAMVCEFHIGFRLLCYGVSKEVVELRAIDALIKTKIVQTCEDFGYGIY